ncbi:MAG: DUF805 domain-containing protein [Paracoccaceae bacterium]
MTPREALESALAKAFVFRGRASRAEFWWVALFWALTYVTLTAVGVLSFGQAMTFAILAAFVLVTFLPMLALSVRRLQDTGRDGWGVALPIVGAAIASGGRLVGSEAFEFSGQLLEVALSLVLIVWYAERGDPRPNAYGPPPDRSS